MKKFSIKEALSFAWEVFKKHPWLLIGVTLTTQILPKLVQYAIDIPLGVSAETFSGTGDAFQPASLVGLLVSLLLSIFLSVGSIHIMLLITDKKTASFSDLFNVKLRQFLMMILTGILGVLIFIPVVLIFIIPSISGLSDTNAMLSTLVYAIGIVLTIALVLRLQFSSYFIVDKNQSAIDAIKNSFRITAGYEVQLFLLLVVFLLIGILGVLALFVGILVATPVTAIAQTYVYRKLSATS